ncbi:HD-GYP domain-containing protein [Peribacillus sp. SCS-37]|uniref:HD-GYP domain-containing protein n=1 Tax=Paraperibacillus esterisolvens TaxID=3115296 RepID=UPI0039063161
MQLFRDFQKRMLFNYMFGSFIAVFGIGSLFIFHTLILRSEEIALLLCIMLISFAIMAAVEYAVYRHHIKPIRKVYETDLTDFSSLEKAYHAVHSFPVLTVKRILGPHFLGVAFPSSILVSIFISTGHLHIPYHYIFISWAGAFLIASMHAIIEFFLTYRTITPLITDLLKRTERSTGILSLPEKNTISLKSKILYSSLFIAIFPLMIFILVSWIQLKQLDGGSMADYWRWAVVILAVILFLSTFSSLLLYENINNPMEKLKIGFAAVEMGKLTSLENIYSDEFSRLVAGFNSMTNKIITRDRRNGELLESFYTVFAATLDARDPYTAGHSERVAEYSVSIGKKAGLGHVELDLLRKSALLHDIGKIGISDAVLLKEGRLTAGEYEEIKKHPVIGANILEQINLPKDLRPLLPGVKYHHERYDGRGYPEGLTGENIPLFGRIMAVADAFDAMTSDRPYRRGMASGKALDILQEGRGTQWDPVYVDFFIELNREKETVPAAN